MPKTIDLTGKTIGSLYVHYRVEDRRWRTECLKCGRIKDIRAYDLNSGRVTTCVSCKRIINLRGQTFGMWNVLRYAGRNMWVCKCSCENHTTRLISSFDLRTGRTKSCGCISNAFQDLTGQFFGEWEVLEYAGNKRWLCRCTRCGFERLQDTSALKRGLTHKCKKCADKEKEIDLTEKDFGMWHVIGHGTKKGYWTCKCKCSRIKEVSGYSLRAGLSTNCGCKGLKSIDQIDTFSSIEKLHSHIENLTEELGHKPTSFEIADSLGVTYNSVNRKIKGHDDIKELMTVGASHYGSKIENEIYEYVLKLAPDAIKHDRQVLQGNELDIYIPSKKIAIEFNGNYWHSTIFKDRKYHQNKTIKCIKNGIHLIHIFEYEWKDNLKQEIIKQILDNLLCSNNVIFARNTEVKTVTNKDAEGFLIKNHLQAYVASSINIGLYYKDELIGIMTFGKPRFNSDYEYELLRLAFKGSTTVVGGAEKMFKHFIDEIKPISILSYCNLSKFVGNIYIKLGFSRVSLTEPNYVWVNSNNEVLTRYTTTKKHLKEIGFDSYGDTEDEIMENLGYYKIYDSGNLKLAWYNNSK